MNTSSLQPLWRLCLSASVQAVVFVLLFSSSSFAQALRLDSLWSKITSVNAMIYSRDSKQVVIAADDGWLRIFNAADGNLLDSVAPRYGCWRLKYSPDGSLLFAMGTRGIHVFRAGSYETVDSIPLQLHERNDYDSWCEEIDIAPDGKHIAVKGSWHTGNPTDNYMRMVVLSYPEKQRVWSKDLPGVNGNVLWARGAIAFSLDGQYILGQSGTALARWDWRSSDKPAEYLLLDLPNLDLLDFSPNRNYFVLQSNYIYSIAEKKLLNQEIEGLTKGSYSEYGKAAFFLPNSSTLIITDNNYPQFVSLTEKRIFYHSTRSYVGNLVVSPDSNYLLALIGSGVGSSGVIGYRINWNITPVEEDIQNKVLLSLSPLPSKEHTAITVHSPDLFPDCSLRITNMQGMRVLDVYTGTLNAGDNSFVVDNTLLPSGNYVLSLRYASSLISKSFIITK